MTRRRLRAFVPLFFPLCLAACLTEPGERDPAASTVSVIVKFRDPAFEPARGAYLATLSREVGATLVYSRPMSGGAHVFWTDLDSVPEDERLRALLARLSKRPEVEYAVENRRFHKVPAQKDAPFERQP